ncbi:MAG: peptidylprolyl isomerase [Gammaproteobacteria bacterium]|nr:peptidylprolyl isomerase [Gammaproteobacteria bacterium]
MKVFISTFALALIATSILSSCDLPSNKEEDTEKKAAASADTSKVLVQVNGTAITQSEYEVFVRSISNEVVIGSINDAKKAQILNEMVDRQLLVQYANKWGLENDARLAIALKQQQQLMLALAAKKNMLENDGEISEEQLKARYAQEKEKAYPTEYHIKHINVATEDEALSIIKSLDGGEDFSALATKLSLDKSRENGGDLGWVNNSTILPLVFDHLINLENDSYSRTPVQTQAGWQILLMVESRPVTFLEFSQARPRLLAALQRERLMNTISSMRDTAKIEFSKVEQD